MCQWTHERIENIGRVLGLTEDQWNEIDGLLHMDHFQRARLVILQTLDERLKERKIRAETASSLYLELGYSPLELVIIRWTGYNPNLGIGFRPKNEADG